MSNIIDLLHVASTPSRAQNTLLHLVVDISLVFKFIHMTIDRMYSRVPPKLFISASRNQKTVWGTGNNYCTAPAYISFLQISISYTRSVAYTIQGTIE